ncbi:MAG: hypothetical protein JF588_14880 [Caulobacterales bacterium]|nr:hypothetical protein [Caulobacterales bacterium]
MDIHHGGRAAAGLGVLGALGVLALGLFLAGPAAAGGYRTPRTWFGAPDLQGTWSNASMTRLTRPPEAKVLVVGEAEAAALEAAIAARRAHPADDALGQTESEWRDQGKFARLQGQVRTSWIVSPENGQLPYSAAGKALMARWSADQPSDGPEQRPPSERCLMAAWGAAGPPILNPAYADGYQIVQTREAVVIVSEVNHEVRIVRLGGGHLPADVRQWGGDSVGHWEGETLVVETRGFHLEEVYRQPIFVMSPDAKVTERFTRVAKGELKYAFSVEDPAVFSQVWRAEMPFVASTTPLYEYACHEGNYSMANMLGGARREEADAAAAKAAGPGR